jgi:argininosuccinate lyase
MIESARAAALEIGERLTQAPSQRLVAIAFAHELKAQRGLEESIGWVDIAHTLCLAEANVIPRAAARDLLGALLELHAGTSNFSPTPEFGDLYTNREAWIAERTPAVGWLGAGRARREALTTAFHLVSCEALCALGEALVAAVETLGAFSLRHKETLAPDYTYLQAAQPTSFGHYAQCFAWPMLRDLDRIAGIHARADHCPAGVGASNGSAIPQDRRALARRLGFAAPVRHARDAMWQADLPIEALGVAVAAIVNLDRLAEDLMIFASSEFGFVRLADRQARASKIMPQKRNPFALAFVRATANRLVGVQAAVAAAGRTPSGQPDNRLFVYEAVPEALRAAADAAALLAECVRDLEVDESRARAALADGSVCAADLAERLTAQTGVDYRRAHGAVGSLMARLDAQGRSLAQATAEDLAAALLSGDASAQGADLETILAAALDPATCLAARTGVGSAAPEEVAAMTKELGEAAAARREAIASWRARRMAAIDALLKDAAAFVAEGA